MAGTVTFIDGIGVIAGGSVYANAHHLPAVEKLRMAMLPVACQLI